MNREDSTSQQITSMPKQPEIILDKRAEKLKDLFDEIDLDESGELCLEEMRIVLSEKGYSDHFIEVS